MSDAQTATLRRLLLQLQREVVELQTQNAAMLQRLNKLLAANGWNPVEGDNG